MSTKESVWSKDVLRDLAEGKTDPQVLLALQSSVKDEGRFEAMLEVEQTRVPWSENILVPIGEHLYVVQKGKERIVKCSCGHEFGDYRQNWKKQALINVRDTEESLEEIFAGPRKCDPEWMVLREFLCPGCASMLEVEAVPPGYPLVFDFLPELD
jgi:acetone carboxylase gamma subunit